jgi:hypothetical protein
VLYFLVILRLEPQGLRIMKSIQVLKYLYKRGQMYGLFFKVLFETGMRKGEAAALQWTDIDWKNEKITIDNSLNFQPEEDEEILGDTKNFNSLRTIEVRSTYERT